MNNTTIKKNADILLYEYGLLNKLKSFGQPHVIGSYRMDMMAWNDLDIDIENDSMSLDKLYELSAFIIKAFKPVWYEAKEVINEDGKKVWFHGFETLVTGDLWNVDLWFFDKETIKNAETYCDSISSKATSLQRDSIISIKRELLNRGLYSFEQYTSIDVYSSVLEHNVSNIDEFLKLHK